MSKQRKSDGFNLAFLDVMACGLGAVLMILIVVKFNASTSVPSDEIERLQSDLAGLQQQQQETLQQLQQTDANLSSETASAEQIQSRIEQLQIQQQAAQRALDDQLAVLANLEQAVAAAAPETADDNLSLSGSGEESYLLGLKVEGKAIGILLDYSASMTDEGLVDVIKRKIGSAADKQRGPKWQRAKRVAKWLLARLPQSSQVALVAFNEQAQPLGLRAVNSAKVSSSMNALSEAIDGLVPQHGTNLQQALMTITQAMPDMTDLYVITDGLPTLLSDASGLQTNAQCQPLPGKMKTIDGDCRLLTFLHSFQTAAPKSVRTNIILLPMEGDPQAASAYWNWADITGGLLISPARSWP
ncbi:vWA domain-containing protein [Idiomarina xiamenensis]|uniref:Secreted protein, containing von Willebrand factor (VWF) type A domain n=1 Tax=Idiomarina xiamenensis 10-D-4 TaxID=740709 RepID=K2K1T3_9GAMM|nr:vWA domain-containing protein [Idiomarina xiamenensis]EKE80637.1 Secreted protein, containing von Willebrand factor (vWF) type A domain [Idiomarina xiamenensis 10-D-4]